MQKFEVEIEGITPYMQCRMDDQKLEEWEKSRGLIIEREDVSKEDLVRAEYHMYRNSKGQPYLPSEHIRGSLISAGNLVKAKVGNVRKSMRNIVAGMFFVEPTEILLNENWIIDKRSAVNRNIKGRIIVIRPKWENWKARFTLLVDNPTITIQTIQTLLEYAGSYIGTGSFRPEKSGMFGRFKLNKIEKIN